MSAPWNQVTGMMSRVSKTNALYPLLIALVLTSVLSSGIIIFVSNVWIQGASLLLPGFVIWKIIGSFDYFMRNNPEMLRSETHVTQMKALEILGDNLNGSSTTPADVISILNPHEVIELPEAGENTKSLETPSKE